MQVRLVKSTFYSEYISGTMQLKRFKLPQHQHININNMSVKFDFDKVKQDKIIASLVKTV